MRRTISLFLSTAVLIAAVGFCPDRSEVAAAPGRPTTIDPDDFAFPARLSETGLYADLHTRRPAESLVPYEVNAPFWSDGAVKRRFLKVPAGEAIVFHADRPWEFPDRTMFVLTLTIEDGDYLRVLETRVIQIHGDHLHFGTYVWNEEATEAELRTDGDDFYANYGGFTQLWEVASVADCTECHTPVTHQVLGLSTRQINRDLRIGERSVNQLRVLAERGVLKNLPESLDGLPRQCDPMDEGQELETRARSYMETNCGVCHRPGGNGSGTLDLRIDTPLHESGAIRLDQDFRPTRGVLVPGRPERSKLVNRMRIIGGQRMPNVLSTVPDEKGVRLISDWIRSK